TDPLVVDAGDPLPPEIWKPSLQRDPGEDADDHHADQGRCDERDRLVERNGRPAQLAQHVQSSVRGDTPGPGRPVCGPGPGGSCCVTISWKSAGSAARKVKGLGFMLCLASSAELAASRVGPNLRVSAILASNISGVRARAADGRPW